MVVREPLRTNGEHIVSTTDDILDFELQKPGVETKFLDNTGLLARSQVVLRFCTCLRYHWSWAMPLVGPISNRVMCDCHTIAS